HKFFPFAIDDPQHERRYSAGKSYSNSKLANMVFTLELVRRLNGTQITAVAIGLIKQDMAGGAMPTLYAATVPDLPGGTLIGPGNFLRTKGFPRPEKPSPKATDPRVGRRLWELSEELTDVRFLSS